MSAGYRGGGKADRVAAIIPLTLRVLFFGYKNLNVLLVSAAC